MANKRRKNWINREIQRGCKVFVCYCIKKSKKIQTFSLLNLFFILIFIQLALDVRYSLWVGQTVSYIEGILYGESIVNIFLGESRAQSCPKISFPSTLPLPQPRLPQPNTCLSKNRQGRSPPPSPMFFTQRRNYRSRPYHLIMSRCCLSCLNPHTDKTSNLRRLISSRESNSVTQPSSNCSTKVVVLAFRKRRKRRL